MKTFLTIIAALLAVCASGQERPGGGGTSTITAKQIAAAGGVTTNLASVGLAAPFAVNFQLPTLTYGSTNHIWVGGAAFAPWYNGVYDWSTQFRALTNSINVGPTNFLRLNSFLSEWEFTTNLADLSGNNIKTYYYAGANLFPTNDPLSWAYGLPAISGTEYTTALYIGSSNNPVYTFPSIQLTGSGAERHFGVAVSGAVLPNSSLADWTDINFTNLISTEFSFGLDNVQVPEILSNVSAVFNINGHQGVGNYNNVNTFQFCIDGGRIIIERNKGVTNSAGAIGMYRIYEDAGGLAFNGGGDYYVKDEYCHQMYGNLTPLHYLGDSAPGLHSPAWNTFYGGSSNATANVFATVLIAPTNLPTPILNGGINNDGNFTYVDEVSTRGPINTPGFPITNATAYFPTNIAPLNVLTNDLVAGAWNLQPNSRGALIISAWATATLTVPTNGALQYSNAVTGKIMTAAIFSIPAGVLAADTQTNELCIPDISPNSMFRLSAGTPVPNTTIWTIAK